LPWAAPALPEGPIDAGTPPPATPAPPPPPGARPAVLLLPRGVGEVVDTAIGVYRHNWRLLVGTAAVVIVPIQLFSAFLNRGAAAQLSDLLRSLQSGVTPTTTGSSLGILGQLLWWLALPFLTAALIAAVASCYMGNPITAGQAWRRTMQRFWAVLGLGLLRVLLIGVGLLFLAVPGIFLYIKLVVAPVALMVEGTGPIGAMERSWRLTKGLWWRVFGVQVLRVVLGWFGLGLFQTLALGLSLVTGPAGWLFSAIGGSVAQLLVYPFVVSVTVVLYFDLRIRKEGFDLAVTAQQLQAPRAA
jgi:hypothetical protein